MSEMLKKVFNKLVAILATPEYIWTYKIRKKWKL